MYLFMLCFSCVCTNLPCIFFLCYHCIITITACLPYFFSCVTFNCVFYCRVIPCCVFVLCTPLYRKACFPMGGVCGKFMLCVCVLCCRDRYFGPPKHRYADSRHIGIPKYRNAGFGISDSRSTDIRYFGPPISANKGMWQTKECLCPACI